MVSIRAPETSLILTSEKCFLDEDVWQWDTLPIGHFGSEPLFCVTFDKSLNQPGLYSPYAVTEKLVAINPSPSEML